MSKWTTIGDIVDILVFVLVVASFFLHWILGLILVIVWVAGGSFVGEMFRELDREEASPKPQESKRSPYADLVGSQAETISELKPQGSIRICENRIDAKSAFGFISKGRDVRIVEALPDSVVVEEMKKA